jgi:pimeloyl-ACP methyl ester carboxylesterase
MVFLKGFFMDLRERYIETNGVRLHVVEAGPADGPMVLFLHGFPEFWYAWRKQLPFFAEKGFLAVAPDQRGYNLSDKPAGIAAYGIDELAKDITGLIDAYGQKQVYLVGHDWGASVAWWTAIKYPGRIQKLVILNVPHPKVMARNVFKNTQQMKRSWYIFFFQIPGAVEKLAADTDYEWVLEMVRTSANPGAFTPEELEKYREAFKRPGAFTAMVNWYRAMIQTKQDSPLGFDVAMPMMLMWGEQDVSMLSQMADESMSYCKQGKLIKMPDVSHWIQHEQADKVNVLIEDFITE